MVPQDVMPACAAADRKQNACLVFLCRPAGRPGRRLSSFGHSVNEEGVTVGAHRPPGRRRFDPTTAPCFSRVQLYMIVTTHQTAGVSLLTWWGFAAYAALWLVYSVVHRAWPVMISALDRRGAGGHCGGPHLPLANTRIEPPRSPPPLDLGNGNERDGRKEEGSDEWIKRRRLWRWLAGYRPMRLFRTRWRFPGVDFPAS